MFKYHKGMVPKSVRELFTLNSSNRSYNIRNKDKIRSAYGKHKFMYRNFRTQNFIQHNIIGYEPADLTVHPPPKTIEGGFIFFA